MASIAMCEAQLRARTTKQREFVQAAQEAVARAALEVKTQRDAFAALHSMARIMSSHDGED